MENVYALIGYESVTGQTLNNLLMRLLPLVNVADAHQDFITLRGSGGGSSSSGTSASSGASRVAGNLDVEQSNVSGDDLNLPHGNLGYQVSEQTSSILY